MQERVEVEIFQHITTLQIAEGHVVGMLRIIYMLAKPLTSATLDHLPTILKYDQAMMRPFEADVKYLLRHRPDRTVERH